MKLLIVDDHPVLREGFAALLGQCGPDTTVLQAGDTAEALGLMDAHGDLDLVVLDLVLPGTGGLTAISEFRRRHPELPVIVLSSSENPRDALKALENGALGYVPKSASQNVLLAAIKLVLGGELYVPPMILNELGPRAPPGVQADGPLAAARLTERQIAVLRCLGEGRLNKEIAVSLAMSEKTVKVHITAIFKTLRVINRTQAVTAARDAGII